jgi:hypothetical protein
MGAPGLAGPAGATGPTGAPGSTGAAGAAGAAFSNVFSVSPGTGSYTIPNNTVDGVFFTSSGNTVTLPTAASQNGRKIWIAMTNIGGGNSFTVSTQDSPANIFTSGSCPANGPTVCPGVVSVTFEQAVQFFSDGTRWNAAYTGE